MGGYGRDDLKLEFLVEVTCTGLEVGVGVEWGWVDLGSP